MSAEVPELIGGPYKRPYDVRPEQRVKDERRGFCVVTGFTKAPIEWPIGRPDIRGARNSPILCGDLVKAVKTESVEAIVYHWGVSRDLVQDWRRALNVGRMNPGTRKRWKDLAEVRLSEDARKKGAEAAHTGRRLIRALIDRLKEVGDERDAAIIAEAEAYFKKRG